METLRTEFTQHYSTAAQMTIDTSGKAEPTAPAATVRQTEPAPAQKAPPRGENVAAIEAKVNAGETINLSDLASAIKADKQTAQTTPPMSVTATAAEAGDQYSEEQKYVEERLSNLTLGPSAGTFTFYPGSPNSGAVTAKPSEFTDNDLAAYADRIFELVNREREKAGAEPLERSDFLDEAANTRAMDCASVNSLYVNGQVKMIEPEVFHGSGYGLTLMDDYQEYIKRLIIKLEKPIGRDLYNRRYESLQKQLNPEIYELAPSTKLGHFPGYQSVSLKHRDLRQIISRNEPSWKQALLNVKGVYVITDTSNGNLYIGSASGNSEGIWQRWSGYADINNLTGGNKEFVDILETKGEDYIVNHFKYSILEIFDTKTKVETVIERESYWKNVFDTRTHGMNHN